MKPFVVCIASFIVFAGTKFLGAELIHGMNLIEDLPEASEEIRYEDIRKENQLSIKSVVKIGDDFLSQIRPDLKPIVSSVSFRAVTVKKGRIWCWVISYQHPESKNFSNMRIFQVYISKSGKPLMKLAHADNR